MATTGDLKDISLVSLVQMISLERRSVVLIVKKGQEEGVLYFWEGDVIHARTRTLIGEEAARAIFCWAEGIFQIADFSGIPRRTIQAPTEHLLLKIANDVDEGHACDPTAVIFPKENNCCWIRCMALVYIIGYF